MKFRIPEPGEKRTRRIFLWLPKQATAYYRDTYKSKEEIRWLEFANVKEIYTYYYGWKIIEFLN